MRKSSYLARKLHGKNQPENTKIVGKSSKTASEKFWQIEKIIHNEKRNPGVLIEMKRSSMFTNILSLLKSKCIKIDDLSDFSEDLQKNVKQIWEAE